MLTTLGLFGCILAMRRNDTPLENISDLAGLSQNSKIMAFVMAMFMFSLAGIPPLAGFFGKYIVFLAAYHAGLLPLVLVGLIASVVSAFYYIRVVLVMYVEDPEDAFDHIPSEIKMIVGISTLFVVGYFAIDAQLFGLAKSAAQSLF